MAAPIGTLRAELSAGHAQFASDMKKAKGAVKTNATGMQRAMNKVSKSFTKAAGALNRYAGFAMVAAAAAAAVFIKKQIDLADKMSKLAQATGTTSEYLSSMALVASQGGTTLEAVAKGVKKLSQNMDDVRRGTGEAREAFEDLNLKVIDSAGVLRKSDQVMLDIADKFKGMEDGAEKTAYAMAIFGRAGGELIPMLNGGREGIEQLQKKAEEMGLVISTKTALEAAYLNDQLDIMTKTVQGTGRSMALDLIPWLNETLAVMKLAKEESGTLMAAWVGLGGVGMALFGKSLQQKINETKKDLEDLNRIADEGADWKDGKQSNWEKKKSRAIQEVEDELADLEAQKEQGEAADKARMEASMKRMQDEAEQRRKNTEAIRTQAQEKIDAAMTEKEAEAAEKAKVKASEDAEDAIYDQIAALELQRDMFGKTTEEITLYKMSLMEGVTPAQMELTKAILATITAQKQQKAETEETKDDLEDLADTGKTAMETLTDAVNNFGAQSSQAWTDFALHGKASFSDMIDSMIDDLVRMMIQEQIMGPMFRGISGGLSSLFPSAKGNAFQGGNVVPFARGGVITKPTIFPMAQGAGLVAEAGYEAAMPLTRMANGNLGVESSGGGGMQVNIYNTTGDSVETKQGKTADGSPTLDVMIDQAVAKKLGTFGSKSNKVMRQNFGASQRLTGR